VAVNLDPRLAVAYVNMGNAKKKVGDYQGALYDFSEALKLDTALTEVYNYRGEAYLITGSTELARDDFGNMISRHPAMVLLYVVWVMSILK